MIIRTETPDDYAEVCRLIKAAFATTDFSDGSEADYLNALRHSGDFLPELSLVAVEGNAIIGQIALCRMRITCSDRTHTQLVLSPLSVRPDSFNRGVGARLIRAGCERAAGAGFGAVFLCGDPRYYERFGFVPTYRYGIYHVKDADKNADWCMVRELRPGCLHGVRGRVDIQCVRGRVDIQ